MDGSRFESSFGADEAARAVSAAAPQNGTLWRRIANAHNLRAALDSVAHRAAAFHAVKLEAAIASSRARMRRSPRELACPRSSEKTAGDDVDFSDCRLKEPAQRQSKPTPRADTSVPSCASIDRIFAPRHSDMTQHAEFTPSRQNLRALQATLLNRTDQHRDEFKRIRDTKTGRNEKAFLAISGVV